MDQFTQAYIACALWAETDDNGTPLDRIGFDLAPEALATMEADCARFQAENVALLAVQSHEQNVHDFWLTRDRHGAGFWDRGLGEVGDKLTAAAHAYRECSLYVGDDGLIYSFNG